MASPRLPSGQLAKELLSPCSQNHRKGLPYAQIPSSDWSTLPCPIVPSCLLAAGLRLSAQGEGDTCLATGPLFPPGPSLLLRDRFPTTRPMTPSLFLGQRAALTRDRLLGSAVTHKSLSLRIFPQAQPRFCLRQKGCPGKVNQAPCGFITPCWGVLHRQAAAASHRPDSDFPENAVFSQRECPRKTLSLYAGSSCRARILG